MRQSTVLIFCSWLETNSNIGIFFREQAAILKPEFEPILIVFKRQLISIKNPIKFSGYFNFIELKSPENINVLEVYYPEFTRISNSLNKYLRDYAIILLKAYLDKNKIYPSLIHAQSLFYAGFWAHKYFKKYEIPYILTEHNQISFFGVSQQKLKLIRNILNDAKKNLVVCFDKVRQFAANNIYFDFINIGNLIGSSFYYLQQKEPRDSLNLITVGDYHPIKDQKTLFDALAKIDKLIIDKKINFTWIGYNGWGGDKSSSVKKLVAYYNFKNINVELIPVLGRTEIAIKLNNSDLFLFSSISEGMPVSVLEALACGLPVFSSNCGGVDEVINKNNGEIYPIKDSNKLHQLLLDFINKTNKYNGKLISNEIISKFGTIAFKKKLVEIYNSVINDSSY